MGHWNRVHTFQLFSFASIYFTKRTDVVSQYLVMSRSREIQVYAFQMALEFDRYIGNNATEMPVKFQSDHYSI